MTATDGNGLFTDKIVNIFPRKSQVSLATSPPGLGLMVDGVPVSTPRTFTGVEGFQRELVAPQHRGRRRTAPRSSSRGWSDGKSIRHVISTPEDDTTYTATYGPSQPFTAKYYDNTTFSGTPVVTRQDPNINFAWGEGSPDPALPSDGFSVRWTKTQWFGAGRYEFTAVADDGVRLYIDGRRVIDQWQGPANTEFTHTVELGEGKHTIKMDYVERRWRRARRAHWDGASDQPSDTYRAEYWNAPPGVNAIPGTGPELARDEETIDHDWGDGSPGPAIAANRFAGPVDAHDELRARRLRVRGDRRRRRAAVRRRGAGDRQVDRPGADHLPHDAAARRRSPHRRHGVLREQRRGDGPPRLQPGRRPTGRRHRTTRQYWNTPDAVGPAEHPDRPGRPRARRRDARLRLGRGSPGSRHRGGPVRGPVDEDGGPLGGRSTGSAASATTGSGPTSTTCRWSTNGPIGNEEYSVDKVVSGGPHELRVEYFEAGGGARAEFSYERIGDVVPGDGGYTGEYFDNRNLAGTPVAHPPGRRRRLRLGRRAARRTASPPTTSRPGGRSRWPWTRRARTSSP